jgi:hypothetical protein
MILVFASIFNKAAAAFVTNYKGAAASLVTCSTISLQQSCFTYPNFDDSYITINSKKLFVNDIKGIINLLPGIIPYEMYFYNEAEYAYQAQEFTALLGFFLQVLDVPVINRPSPHNLSGKILNDFGWHHLASTLQIPQLVASFKSNLGKPCTDKEGDLTTIVYCNKEIWPANANPIATKYTIRLAEHTEATYLAARFTTKGPLFVNATTVPDANLPEIRELLYRALKTSYSNESIFMGSIGRSTNQICV